MTVLTSYKSRQKIFGKHSNSPHKIRRVSRKMSSRRDEDRRIEEPKTGFCINLLRICKLLSCMEQNHEETFSRIYTTFDGFGGLVVRMLASGSEFVGSNPTEAVGLFLCKKSSACLPPEGKLNNLSHVPPLRHVKEPISHRKLRADSQIPSTKKVPSFASRGLLRRLV
jgi:hypothetical protein